MSSDSRGKHDDMSAKGLPLATRVEVLEVTQSRHEQEIRETRSDLSAFAQWVRDERDKANDVHDSIFRELAVLKARVGIYAAVGAAFGGAIAVELAHKLL